MYPFLCQINISMLCLNASTADTTISSPKQTEVALNQYDRDTTSHGDLCVTVLLQVLFKREFNLPVKCDYRMI